MSILKPELLFIFALAFLMGLELMRKTSSAMHTPLSMAIITFSGMVLIAAITLTANADDLLGKILGSLSVLISSMNIVVSLVVMKKMIKMLEGKSLKGK